MKLQVDYIKLYHVYSSTTTGGFPYPDLSNKVLVDKVLQGYRMKRPSNCSEDMWAISFGLSCWLDSCRPYAFTSCCKHEMYTFRHNIFYGSLLHSYDIMANCWKQCPEDRPTFCETNRKLSDLIEQNNNESYISMLEQCEVPIESTEEMEETLNVEEKAAVTLRIETEGSITSSC